MCFFVETDRDAAMTLKGYVHHHSEFCTMDDCPLKNFKKQLMKDREKEFGQFGPLIPQMTMYSAVS